MYKKVKTITRKARKIIRIMKKCYYPRANFILAQPKCVKNFSLFVSGTLIVYKKTAIQEKINSIKMIEESLHEQWTIGISLSGSLAWIRYNFSVLILESLMGTFIAIIAAEIACTNRSTYVNKKQFSEVRGKM